MARQRSKTATLLFATVYVGFLCLLQVACKPDRAADDPESNLIDPDKFSLELEDVTQKSNLVAVKITPGSPGMNLKEFLITASIVDNKGIVRGAANKQGSKVPAYTADLNGCGVATLSHRILKAKKDSQGKPITLRAQAIPGTSIKQGDTYTLTVTVERKGSHAHTETKSIEFTAQQDGVAMNTQTKEASFSDTSAQTSATTLGTASDNAIQPISQPAPNEASSIPTDAATTKEASPQMCVSDTDLPVTPNGEIPNVHLDQITDLCDGTINALDSNTDTNSQTATSEAFTVTLKGEKRSNGVRNFALVTIKPSSSGMKLKEFAVTAHLENDLGVVNGSSGRNDSGFVYGKDLNNCNLEKLFLTNKQSNCLGENDAHFAQGGEVAFRIAVEPGATVRPDDQYTLTMKVAYTGSNPHTETRRETLTAPKASPVKGPKRTSPRKSK